MALLYMVWRGARTCAPVAHGSTTSHTLIISREGRFTLIESGCFGSSEVNRGSVAYRGGILRLDPTLPVGAGFTSESRGMIPVRFGGRVYLVGVDRVTEFTNAINAALVDTLEREGASAAFDRLRQLGARLGSRAMFALGDAVNANPPVLKLFSRFGSRGLDHGVLIERALLDSRVDRIA